MVEIRRSGGCRNSERSVSRMRKRDRSVTENFQCWKLQLETGIGDRKTGTEVGFRKQQLETETDCFEIWDHNPKELMECAGK